MAPRPTTPHPEHPTSLRGRVKALARRLVAPGLHDLRVGLDRIDTRMTGEDPGARTDTTFRGGGLRGLAWRTVYRAMRPAVNDVAARLSDLERRVGARSEVGIWRGGLRGHAIDPAGAPNVGLSKKYGPELAFWEHLVHTDAQRLWNSSFFDQARGWQAARIQELGQWLGLKGTDAVSAWSSERTAVEIGAGPFPSIAMTPWRRAVAVDPIADGYAAEGLLPPEADEVIYLSSQGESIPLPTGSVDLIVIENALDHVSDPLATAREMRRLLKDDGYVWLLVDLMTYKDEMHPHPFSEDSLRAMLREAGLTPVRDRVNNSGGCHPKALGEYRGLLAKIGSPTAQRGLPIADADRYSARDGAARNGHAPEVLLRPANAPAGADSN